MCCNCKERLVIISMAIWTLFQSLVYAVFAILGILVYECEMDMNSDQLSYLWYLIYFRRGSCGLVNWNYLGLNIPNTLQPIWPEVTQVAFRTNIIVIVYLSLSMAWVVTSLGIILSSFTSCIGRCYYYSSLILWSTIGILLLVLDCVAVGFFVYDLVNITGFGELLEFLEITNAQDLVTLGGDFWAPYFLPSLLMMIIAARAFLIWGFNIAIICLVIRFGSRIGRRIPKTYNNNSPPTPYRNGREANPASPYSQEHVSNNGMYPMRVTSQYNNAQPYGVANNNSSNNELTHRVVPAAAVQTSQSDRNTNNYPQNYAYDNPTYPAKRNTPSDNMSQNSSIEPRSSDSGWVSSPSRPKKTPPETPPKPILKVKSTQVDKVAMNDVPVNRNERNSLLVPPEELRSQLPWSYTSNPDELNKPRRAFVALNEEDDLPPIPVPDYTLHFPKNKRSGIDNK